MKPAAPVDVLDRFAPVLVDLAGRHGLSNLRHGGPGTVVVDVAPGRSYFDLAEFEYEAEAVLDYDLFVVSSGAPAAGRITGEPLGTRVAA